MRKLVMIAGVVLVVLATAMSAAAQRPAGATAGPAKPAAGKAAPRFETRAGYAACRTRPKLDTLVMYVAEHDTARYRKTVTNPKGGCFRLKGGLDVVPIGTDNLVVQFRLVGQRRTFFTVIEALKTAAPRN